MRPLLKLAGLAAPLLLLAACDHDGAHGTTLSYSSTVDAGHWVRLRNTNGSVRIQGGDQFRVTAEQVGRTNPNLRVVIDTTGGDVTVCAVFSESAECTHERYRTRTRHSIWARLTNQSRNTNVRFTVVVPDHVKLDASTVNGSVTVDGARPAELIVKSVNGSVKTGAVGGPMRLSTVNGSITARVPARGGVVDLESVNGSVAATVDDGAHGELDLRTVNGKLSADIPNLVLDGPISNRRMRALLGGGGPRIRVKTVNGSITLKRS